MYVFKLNEALANNMFCSVDIAGTSVEQSEARYKDLIERSKHDRYQDIFDAEFITADCSRVRNLHENISEPDIRLFKCI